MFTVTKLLYIRLVTGFTGFRCYCALLGKHGAGGVCLHSGPLHGNNATCFSAACRLCGKSPHTELSLDFVSVKVTDLIGTCSYLGLRLFR